MNGKLAPLHIFLSAFAISSIGGLAALLRSKKQISARTIFSALLYSGMTGLIIALMWYEFFDGQGNIYFLLGVSGLAGIGGATIIDFIVQLFKTGKIWTLVKIITAGKLNITISASEGEDDADDEDDKPDDK